MEKDLFLPIKNYFEGFGYVCDGEVNDIDLYMEKEGEGVAVELKQTLDFRAVQQAALRQKLVDCVFIGTFRPGDMFSHAFRDKLYILKRLGIGLLVVSPKTGAVEVVSEPVVSELSAFQRRNKGKKEALSTEFKKRRVKGNIGGVHGTKLITGYRENALTVLDALTEMGGEARASEVKKASGVEKAREIMYDNHYGWFEAMGKGVYRVTDEGYAALEEFEEILMNLRKGVN